MNFKAAYDFPLVVPRDYDYLVQSENFVHAFDWLNYELTLHEQREIVESINSGKPLRKYSNVTIDNDPNIILVNGVEFIEIRGWGHLTSPNGCNLTAKEAAQVQDEFSAYIVSLL